MTPCYCKTSIASNNPSDWTQLTSKDYVDALLQGTSWREPVLFRDGVNTSLVNATTDANTDDLIDGITLVAGARVLFTNFVTDNNNVYVVGGGSGAWTFTEDSNTATDGDALLVQEGTSADEQWLYQGVAWAQFGGSSIAELGFIRTFIGKSTSGSVLPNYSSTNIITQNTDLTIAIGAIDAVLGDQSYTTQNYVTNGQTFTLSIDALDIQLKTATDAIGTRLYTAQNYVTNGETLTNSIDVLDQEIATIPRLVQATQTGITGATIDSVLVDDVHAVKWHIVVINDGTPTIKRAMEVFALHNGTAAADASSADYNRKSILRFTGGIPGLSISVDVNGAGAAQTMRLIVSSTAAVTIKSTRIDVVE